MLSAISTEEAAANSEWRRWISARRNQDLETTHAGQQSVCDCILDMVICLFVCIMSIMSMLGFVFGLVAWIHFAWRFS
jgi:hypothetical protein